MNANAHAPLTEAEIVERKAFLQRLGLDRKSSAEVVPLRKPLGLAPVLEDTERDAPPDDMAEDGSVILHDGLRFSFKDGSTPETLAQWVNVDLLYTLGNALISTIDTGHQKAKEMAAELRSEVARAHGVIRELQLERERDRASLAEMRSKIAELDFVVGRLKVENAGPIGPPGPRGVDGRDGQRGSRGERGERGPAGPRIVSWETADESFTAVPLGSDGRKGAPLYLRGMFEQYHSQTEGEAAAEEHDAIQAQRAVLEREAERVRQGLPAR